MKNLDLKFEQWKKRKLDEGFLDGEEEKPVAAEDEAPAAETEESGDAGTDADMGGDDTSSEEAPSEDTDISEEGGEETTEDDGLDDDFEGETKEETGVEDGDEGQMNELKDAIEGMLSPETQEKIVANLEIRETFKISKVGTIAGCMCLDGKIGRNHNVRIIRDGIVVYTGKLASLKRFKDDVKEVVSGQDCGLNIEGFNDIKVGDIVEAYEIIEIKRKL